MAVLASFWVLIPFQQRHNACHVLMRKEKVLTTWLLDMATNDGMFYSLKGFFSLHLDQNKVCKETTL